MPGSDTVGESLCSTCRNTIEWPGSVNRSPSGCAHAEGVIHRDLKPSNLFLCHDGSVRVLDVEGPARLKTSNGSIRTQNLKGGTYRFHVKVDDGGKDEKIVAVPSPKLTQRYVDVHNYTDLPKITLEQIRHFFAHYKDLEPNKWVKIGGWEGVEEARKEIMAGVANYQKADIKPEF